MEENKTVPTEQDQEQEQNEKQKTPEEIAEETNQAVRDHIEKEIADPLREELSKVKTENARLLSLLRGTSHADTANTVPDYIEEENKRRRENKSRQMATFIENQ